MTAKLPIGFYACACFAITLFAAVFAAIFEESMAQYMFSAQ